MAAGIEVHAGAKSVLLSFASYPFQRPLQVLPQVDDVFDADADADQAVVDAAGLADFGGDAGVGHGGGVADQGFHAAQALGEAEEAGAADDAESAVLAAADADADHAAERAHLLAGHLVPGMTRQAGIAHAPDRRMRG